MTRQSRGPLLRRIALAAVGLGLVVATFVYFLPTIANYGEVWDVVKELSWPWIAALLGATVINLVTFAPPWMIVLPGLSFLQAMQLTQASTALSIVVPGGPAAGLAGAFGILRRWRFATRDIARALTLTGLWNQLLNLSFPVVAVFLLTISGENTATLATQPSSALPSSASWSPASSWCSSAIGSLTTSARSPPASRTGR